MLERNIHFFQNKKKIGLSFKDFNRLSRFAPSTHNQTVVTLDHTPVTFSSPFWFLHGLEEIFTEEVYKFTSDKKDPYIIDCGANIGLSIIYFKKLFPAAKIIGFEPDPTVFQQLQTNIANHHYTDITLVNAAVWNEETKVLFASEGSVGGSIDTSSEGGNNKIEVNTIQLKKYLSQPVDFLKLDIEGAEYVVLKDCKEELRKVTNLFIEYHEEKNATQHLTEILNWVSEAGFTYYIKEAWDNMSQPFTKEYNDHYHCQLNIFCFRR